MENVYERRRIFLSLSKLESGRQEINSSEIRPHLTFSVNWNKREFILKVTFSLPSPSSMLKLPIIKSKRCWVHLLSLRLYDEVHSYPLVLIST